MGADSEFDLPETCPKCGRGDIALDWFGNHYITPWDLEVALGKCCEVGKCPEGEHMHWSCRSCHYQLRLAPRSVEGALVENEHEGRDRLRDALVQIRNMLSPGTSHVAAACEGCANEMAEAHRLAWTALQEGGGDG